MNSLHHNAPPPPPLLLLLLLLPSSYSADKFETDILKGAAGVGHTEPPEHTVPLAKVPPSKGC